MDLARDLVGSLPSAFSQVAADRVGMTAKRLRGRHVEGLSRGVYRAAAAPCELVDVCRALDDVIAAGAVFSHQTAAALLGLPVVGRSGLHVTMPPHVNRPRRRGVVGHTAQTCADDLALAGGLLVTGAARTFLDHAAAVSLEDLVALGDAILHQRLATPTQLAAVIAAARGRRGVRTARAALPLLDGRTESVPESLLRVRIHFSELPDPEPQLEVCDGRGNPIGHVDLGIEELKIAIEYDGRHHAEKEEQFDYDVGRYTELESWGWHVMRATKRSLRNGSVHFLGRLRRLVRTRTRAREGAHDPPSHLRDVS